jgi:hypothetical protein
VAARDTLACRHARDNGTGCNLIDSDDDIILGR